MAEKLLTRQIHDVMEYMQRRVKTSSKLTNFDK